MTQVLTNLFVHVHLRRPMTLITTSITLYLTAVYLYFISNTLSLLSYIISITNLVYLLGDNILRFITHLECFSRHCRKMVIQMFVKLINPITYWLGSGLSSRLVNCIFWVQLRLGFLLMFTDYFFLKINFYIQIAHYLTYLSYILLTT